MCTNIFKLFNCSNRVIKRKIKYYKQRQLVFKNLLLHTPDWDKNTIEVWLKTEKKLIEKLCKLVKKQQQK